MSDDFQDTVRSFIDGRQGAQPLQDDDFASTVRTFIGDMDEIGRRNAKLNLFGAREVNPDAAARAQDLARQTGLPPETVERNLPEVEQQVRAARQDRILRESPALVQWLQDGANARVAHDDFEKLGFFEKTWRSLSRGYQDAVRQNTSARAAVPFIGGDMDADTSAFVGKNNKEIAAPFGGYDSTFYWFVRKASTFVGGLADQVEQALVPTAAGAVTGAAAGGVAGLGVASPITAPAGAMIGASVGFTSGMVADGFRVGAGQLYLELKDQRDANGNPLDADTVKYAALGGGAILGLLNMIGAKGLEKAAANAVTGAMNLFVRDAVKQRATVDALASAGKGIAQSVATGAGFGVANEATMLAATTLAKEFSGGDWQTVLNSPEERAKAGERLITSALEMGAAFGLMHTPGVGLRFAGDMARVRQAQRDAAFLEGINSAAADSATRRRAPDAFARFVQEQANGSPVETLYIRASKVRDLYHRLGLDPFVIANDADPVLGFLPDLRQQLKLGLAIGGDVAVPLAQYISRLAGTDLHNALKEDIRVRSDGVTLREARELQEYYAEDLAAPGGELRAAVAAAAEKSQSALAVFGDALEKLRVVGSPPDVARQTAMLMSARYDAVGAMLGTDALTEYRRSNIDWQRILPEGLPRDSTDSSGVAGAKGLQQQDIGKLRGGAWFEDGHTIVSLFKQRNLSTVFRELGRVALEDLMVAAQRSEAPQQLRDAKAATLKWFGVKDVGEIRSEHHEQLARGIEAYVMEGKAPSVELGPAFQLFKCWLLSIYGTVETLKAPINDEIRNVFDRMVATDAAVAAAQARLHGRAPASAEWAGMMKAGYNAYPEHVVRSGEVAWRLVHKKVMSDWRRRATPQWKAEEKALRKELGLSIDRQPDIAALHYLGGHPLPDSLAHLPDRPRLKLSREALVEEHGDPAIVKALPRSFQSMVVSKGGVRPSEIAGPLGFADARSMVNALMALAREQDALERAGDKRSVRARRIDDAVERAMIERHGPALVDGSIDAEAMSSLHNKERAKALAAEERTLAKEVGDKPMSYKQAKENARRLLAEQPAGKLLDLSRFLRAEERAALASLNARARGDFDVALSRKREEMIAHAAWREAQDINLQAEAAQRRTDHQASQPRSDARPEANGKIYSVAFEMRLPPRLWRKTRKVHFQRANAALDAALRSDPAWAAQMEELIPGLQASVAKTKGRRPPYGWVWHHGSEPGTMQLTLVSQHTNPKFRQAFHPKGKGGYAIWGPRGKKKSERTT